MLTNRRSAQAVKSTKHSLGQQATDTVARAIEPWFKRRAPLTRDISLGLRNVYIFLSREGIFYLLLLVITFIAGVNYGNNLVLGLCFLLGSLLVITIHYTFAHMAGLRIVLKMWAMPKWVIRFVCVYKSVERVSNRIAKSALVLLDKALN